MRRSLKVSYGRLHPFVLEQTVLAADTLKRRAGLFRGQQCVIFVLLEVRFILIFRPRNMDCEDDEEEWEC